MKKLLGVIAGSFLLTLNPSLGQTETGRTSPSDSAPSNLNQPKAAPSGAGGVSASRVVVRGWEVQSALAIKRTFVTRVLPDYKQRKLVGTVKSELKPRNGEFLVVLLQSRWATTQIPNEPLWTGKPDVTLVDANGVEYPPVDSLGWQSGEYITRGMGAGSQRRNARQKVGKTSQTLVYFDVPSTTRSFSLRVSKNVPLIPVSRVLDLPQLDLGSNQ